MSVGYIVNELVNTFNLMYSFMNIQENMHHNKYTSSWNLHRNGEENKQIGFSFKVLLVDVIFRDGHIIVWLSALLGKLPFVTHAGCVCLFFLQKDTFHRTKYQQHWHCVKWQIASI